MFEELKGIRISTLPVFEAFPKAATGFDNLFALCDDLAKLDPVTFSKSDADVLHQRTHSVFQALVSETRNSRYNHSLLGQTIHAIFCSMKDPLCIITAALDQHRESADIQKILRCAQEIAEKKQWIVALQSNHDNLPEIKVSPAQLLEHLHILSSGIAAVAGSRYQSTMAGFEKRQAFVTVNGTVLPMAELIQQAGQASNSHIHVSLSTRNRGAELAVQIGNPEQRRAPTLAMPLSS